VQDLVNVQTADGTCPVRVVTPDGAGPWPAVIIAMDGLGIRPALDGMAQRLADAGYLVLLPDLFYRSGPYGPFDPKDVFAQAEPLATIGPMMAALGNRNGALDVGALLGYLDTRSDVAGKKVGIAGYCMGGAIALTSAAMYPDRIAVAASFHGGNLASDDEESPHLLAGSIRAEVYVGAAVDDPWYPADMEVRFKEAFDKAGTAYRHETYEGALHGWTMTDFPVYDEAAAERHWGTLLDLYAANLH
jgi:carboxymethylenebutenolidase